MPLGAFLVLAWAWRSGTAWREIGYARPRSWIASVAVGIVFGSAVKLLMKAIVMPLLGADPVNHTYHFLAGNGALLPAAVYSMIVGAGFGEETLFRGYMFERLGKLFGPGVRAKTSIVLLSSVWFGLSHYSDQGARRRRTGHGRRARIWNDHGGHGPDLDADGCARRVRPDRALDDLLEPRIRRG